MSDQLFTDYGRPKPIQRGYRGQPRVVECAVEGCTNPRRNVQRAKYCEEHATCINYELRQTVPKDEHGACLVCQQPVKTRRPIGQQPLFLCLDHRHLRSTFTQWRGKYHLTDTQITEFMADPSCWICEASLKWRFHSLTPNAKHEQIHIDHDHRCCPGERCCGRCVRGLAHQHCNRHLGYLEAMLKNLGPARLHDLVNDLDSSTEHG